jgi:hypothetical protein
MHADEEVTTTYHGYVCVCVCVYVWAMVRVTSVLVCAQPVRACVSSPLIGGCMLACLLALVTQHAASMQTCIQHADIMHFLSRADRRLHSASDPSRMVSDRSISDVEQVLRAVWQPALST